MKKIIAFSFWGDDPVQIEGVYQNLELAKKIYPGWICRFYIAGKNTPKRIIKKIESYTNAEVLVRDEKGTPASSLWKFETVDDADVDFFISREVSSRLSVQEKNAVDAWIESGKTFHIIRGDTSLQFAPMLPGLWGMRRGPITGIKKMIDEFIRGNYYENKKGIDQAFIWGVLWPLAQTSNYHSVLSPVEEGV